jgi:hypothetical protein
MDDETAISNAVAFCERHGLAQLERIGFGIHGIVFLVESNDGVSVIKALRDFIPYQREKDTYQRLEHHHVLDILGFRVPRLLNANDDLQVLQMSLVSAPHVLDFAASFLDEPPEFSSETWAEWERKNEEQFDSDWPIARKILSELESLGIFMLDPSPSNIRFR